MFLCMELTARDLTSFFRICICLIINFTENSYKPTYGTSLDVIFQFETWLEQMLDFLIAMIAHSVYLITCMTTSPIHLWKMKACFPHMINKQL